MYTIICLSVIMSLILFVGSRKQSSGYNVLLLRQGHFKSWFLITNTDLVGGYFFLEYDHWRHAFYCISVSVDQISVVICGLHDYNSKVVRS